MSSRLPPMRAWSSLFTFRNWVASSALVAVSLSPSASAGDPKKANVATKGPDTPPPSADTAWTGPTSLVLAENAARRADKQKTFSSLAIIAERAPVLPFERAEALLAEIGDKNPAWKTEATLTQRIVQRATAAMSEVDLSSLGIVTTATLVGPLRAGTDAGVLAKEPWENGPLPGDLSWGAIEVKPRRFPKAYVTGRGLEFGELVSPRRETCTWVLSQFELKKPTSVRMFVAASGSYRWMVDGTQIDASEEGHRDGIFDRAGASMDLGPDTHTIGVKSCSGALGDRGNVRVRFEDAMGKPLELAHTPFQGPTTGKLANWKRLETPLSKALSEKSTTTELLNNATLREFAGADDARSPKAQGLLDAFFQTTSRTADELGFAAWIAPSASNRTGWLSLLEKEEALKPFVLRRYAVERLRARTPEWAHTVTESRLFGTDREASMIRAEIRLALSPSTSRDACTTLLAEARDPLASTGEISTALSCANLYFPSDALAILRRLSERGIVSSNFVLRAGESNHTAAETANRALGTRAVSLADWESVVPYFASIGKTTLAEDTARTLLLLNPNRGSAWKSFANLSAPDVANSAYRRSRELEPGRADLRALMDLVNAKPGQVAVESHQPDEKYLTPSDVLLKRRGGVGNVSAPEVTERELHWLRVVTLHPDKRVSQLVQYAKEIVVAPRTDDELVEDLPAEGDVTEILKARVHRKDGGFALPVEQQDGPRPSVHWPELAPGDTIEVVLRSWNTSPVGGKADPPFYFMDYGGASSTKPLLYNEVVVVSPASSPLHVAPANGKPDIDERGSNNGQETVRLVWKKPMNVRDEPLAPPLAEVLPIVVGSTFGSWSDFRAWYEGAVAGFTEPDDQVTRLAKELTKGKTSRADKVAALFNFVADQIRYVNYVSGEAWL
ncbi:MAG: hypothetical protein KBF88_16800, partial [Polyangiaceae bacterium]|nr:hypothetical protein [Polyangiaceae bacterium]